MFTRLYSEDAGVLTFEWILLVVLFVAGITITMCYVQNCINTELTHISEALCCLDQSFTVNPPPQITLSERRMDENGEITTVYFPPLGTFNGSVGFSYTDPHAKKHEAPVKIRVVGRI